MRRALACFTFALLVPVTASAQGRVTGVVKDADDHTIKGATVMAESPDQPSVTVTSDRKGRFSFLGLRGGPWTFIVNAPGFHPARRQATTTPMGVNAPLAFLPVSQNLDDTLASKQTAATTSTVATECVTGQASAEGNDAIGLGNGVQSNRLAERPQNAKIEFFAMK